MSFLSTGLRFSDLSHKMRYRLTP